MDSNSTIRKINKSRQNLRKYLSEEWKTDVIKDYSDKEIEKIYKSSQHIKDGIIFGAASSCNISLYHKKIKSHRLHIIYYNFPEIGRPSVKINKQCADKLNNLYEEGIISTEDSLIVILLNPVPETLEKSIEDLYSSGQEDLIKNGLSEQILSENEELDEDKYNNYHFKNVHIFHLATLSIDILNHSMVPNHEVFRFENDIQKICDKCNCRKDQLPIIDRNDAVAKRLRIAPGDICKITRVGNTVGETDYYRLCK
jgi:DNA-directed RNA polymerase subunit H (RpoH/RPB5)|tara:strand:- start:526 stop:1290 length:765 start_codon:yes stop_codon:yes gene_type:complete